MDHVIDLFLSFVGDFIYGTKENPRPLIIRIIVRLIAFGGAIVAGLSMLSLLGEFQIPMFLTFLWVLCSIMVLVAEYFLGSKYIAAIGLLVLVPLLALFSQSTSFENLMEYLLGPDWGSARKD